MARGRRKKSSSSSVEEKLLEAETKEVHSEEKQQKQETVKETKLPKPEENKLKFLVWFSAALKRFKELKPHHMSTLQVYFLNDLGLKEVEDPKVFDEALRKFGFGRK